MWEQVLNAVNAIEESTGKGIWRPGQTATCLLPLWRKILHARHDGHRPQHRTQR